MRFIGAFFQFARRVLDAAKKGGLEKADLRKLDQLLTRAGKRNTIMAKGILSALDAGGASDTDVERFSELLHKAESRIEGGKEPFTSQERNELSTIFRRAYMSDKVTRWFSAQVDELLAEEINEFISGSRRVEIPVPKKTESEAETNQESSKKKKLKI